MTRKLRWCVLGVVVGCAGANRGALAQCGEWDNRLGVPFDLDRSVMAVAAWDPDGSGPQGERLVVGGYFTTAGGVVVNHVAQWDGAQWLPLGDGMTGPVHALATWDPDGPAGPAAPLLVAGGWFTSFEGVGEKYIASWDGASWHALGSGMDNLVNAFTTWDPDGDGPLGEQLVAGGLFDVAGGVTVNGVARWDGATWHALGGGIGATAAVYALTAWDPDGSGPASAALVAGGWFATADGATVNHVARWDPGAPGWQAFGAGMNSTVGALTAWDPDDDGPLAAQLVAGGYFTQADGVMVNGVARWDAGAPGWQALGAGMNDNVFALMSWDADGDGPIGSELVAGGVFTTAGGVVVNSISRWDGSAWYAFGVGKDEFMNAVATWDPDGSGPSGRQLVAGGGFTAAGLVPAGYVAMWVTLGPEITGQPSDVSVATGAQVSFDVDAIDGQLSYRWRHGGVALVNGVGASGSTISGATTPTLTITNVRPGDAGAYDCIVSNSCGGAVSEAAALVVAPPDCVADINGDGLVDGRDLSVVLFQYGSSVPPGTGADFNGDGVVDGRDLSVLLAGYGESC